MEGTSSVIHVEDLTMAYRETPVLWDIDLDVPENVRCAIVGPNGAGKSTLLKGILGLLKPVSGAVQLWGKLLSAVHKQIAYVPQRGSVHWDFPTTVFDVVLMGRYAHLGLVRRPGKEDRALAMDALDKMKMADFANRQISELSGGQKQRVFIARALAQDAQVLILTEPLNSVDEPSQRYIYDAMETQVGSDRLPVGYPGLLQDLEQVYVVSTTAETTRRMERDGYPAADSETPATTQNQEVN